MDGKAVALVTGASRGIGREILHTLAKANYYVVGTATTEAGASGISAALSAQSASGQGKVLNVCDPESVEALLADMKADCGLPAVLVNNAGVTADNLFLRMKPAQWDQVIDTNLSSVYRMTKACLKGMTKARWGRVINITSVVGASGNPGQANYCAAKAGIVGMTKSLAIEMAAYGITFNCVAPGFIQTDMTDALTEEQKSAILQQIPAKSMGRPEDIAAAVQFLASAQSSYITGQTLHVNGGMYLP